MAAPLVFFSLAAAHAEADPASAPSAMPRPPHVAGRLRGKAPTPVDHLCADRCARPVVGLTCGLTHIVDPPSFRAAVKTCVLDIDAASDWR
ncbi:hypothetical protein ABTD73_19105, partial [Acinetobacter baumannii]